MMPASLAGAIPPAACDRSCFVIILGMAEIGTFNEYSYATTGQCYFNVINPVAEQDQPLYLGRALVRSGYRSDRGPLPPDFSNILIVLRGTGDILGAGPDRPAAAGAVICNDSAAGARRVVFAARGEGMVLSFLFTGPGRNLLRGLMAAHGPVQGVDPAHPVIRQALAQTRDHSTAHTLSAEQAQTLVWDWLRLGWPGGDIAANRLQAGLLAALTERDPISSAARRLGLSREHLSRRLRAELGCPPSAWLAAQRLRRAALLLETTAMGVREIGQSVGFASPTAFCAAFRRQHGRSPDQWRRAALNLSSGSSRGRDRARIRSPRP